MRLGLWDARGGDSVVRLGLEALALLEVEEADEHLGIKARYEAQRAPAETRMKTLEAALKQFSVMNRTAVFG